MGSSIKKYGSMALTNKIFVVLLILAFFYIISMYTWTTQTNGKLQTHSDDSHKDLHVTDEIIVVLGYKLHPDGMPTRILRDRVERAANLYKDLMVHGHHPLIIVSGKGKTDNGYTEAQAMIDLCAQFEVRKNDVLMDSESTNTAQNAKFSAELIKNRKDINEVYVVSSEYHIPRAQYLFQTVFPSNIKLGFAGSTNPKDQESLIQKEKILLKSSQQDLQREDVLASTDTDEDRPLRIFPRWRMIEREIDNDLRDGVVNSNDKVTIVEYGSNYGFISAQMAEKFPNGEVISLYHSSYSEYPDASIHHEQKIVHEAIVNNHLCNVPVDINNFSEIEQKGLTWHYQLALGVFHKFKLMYNQSQFEKAIADFLRNARTTFLELPEAMEYVGNEAEDQWELINAWYKGRNETSIIASAGRAHGLVVAMKTMGPVLHGDHSVRVLLRIDIIGLSPHSSDLSSSLDALHCLRSTAPSPSVSPSTDPVNVE